MSFDWNSRKNGNFRNSFRFLNPAIHVDLFSNTLRGSINETFPSSD